MYMGTYNRLNVRVSASPLTVLKAFSRKMIRKEFRFDALHKPGRKAEYRKILKCHESARKLARAVARGF